MIKVLVADDDPDSRELSREVLQSEDCQVLEAADGKEALESIRLNRPDVVLLDVQMPVMDGFSVLQQLRQDPRLATLPVAAVTSHAMHGDRERALAAGFDEYISKPIHPASPDVSHGKRIGASAGTKPCGDDALGEIVAGRTRQDLDFNRKEAGRAHGGARRASGFRVEAELRRNRGAVIQKACVFSKDVGAQVTSAL